MKTYTAAVVAAFALCACLEESADYSPASDPASVSPAELRFHMEGETVTVRLVSDGVSAFSRIEAPAWIEVSVPAGDFESADMSAVLLNSDECEPTSIGSHADLFDCGTVDVELEGGYRMALPVILDI